MRYYFLLVLTFVFTNSHAQLTHKFTKIARTHDHGEANGLATGPDGTVFLAHGRGGLLACKYDGDSLTTIAYVDIDGESAEDVAVSADGTIFLATSRDGTGTHNEVVLRAYIFDGHSFINTANSIDIVTSVTSRHHVALGLDGTIFEAEGRYITAYAYNGVSFTYKVYRYSLPVPGYDRVQALRVGPRGTIFVGMDRSGMRAYNFNGVDFVEAAYVDFDGSSANDIAISADSTVFVTYSLGVRAYSYNGVTFTNTAHIEEYEGCHANNVVAVGQDGTVFVGYGCGGVAAYNYDGNSFTKTAQNSDIVVGGLFVTSDGTIFAIESGAWNTITYDGSSITFNLQFGIGYGGAEDIAFGTDGTIFVSARDGLRAYDFDGVSFESLAHIKQGGNLTVGPDETIYLVSDNGLYAYIYNSSIFKKVGYMSLEDINPEDVESGPDGTIFVSGGPHWVRPLVGRGDDGLFAYSYDGSSFVQIAHIDDDPGDASDIVVDKQGTVFLVNGWQGWVEVEPDTTDTDSIGLLAYNFDGSSFNKTAYLEKPDIQAVAMGPDGNLFLIDNSGENGGAGIYAYRYEASSFIETAYIDLIDEWPADITVSSDGTVFTVGWTLRAYIYDGSTLVKTAESDDIMGSVVAVGHEGTIFVADPDEGVFAYKYSALTTKIDENASKVPHNFTLNQNYPNPFNPTTTISYQLPVNSDVELSIYNLLGQKVATLVSEKQPAGPYKVEWDATGFASGVYLYQITAGGFVQVKKLLLLK